MNNNTNIKKGLYCFIGRRKFLTKIKIQSIWVYLWKKLPFQWSQWAVQFSMIFQMNKNSWIYFLLNNLLYTCPWLFSLDFFSASNQVFSQILFDCDFFGCFQIATVQRNELPNKRRIHMHILHGQRTEKKNFLRLLEKNKI